MRGFGVSTSSPIDDDTSAAGTSLPRTRGAGVAAIYGPGTNIVEAAREVLEKIKEQRES